MPKAPELTHKQKRQHAKEAYEKGNVQEFPGAPVWNEWVKEQRKAKKLEIGLPRRIGRAALETAAVSVLVAKDLPRAVTEKRYESNTQKAKRLERAVSRANSTEAIPSTDLRKVEKSRLRRVGRSVMGALNRSNKRDLQRTSQKVEHLGGKVKANRQAKMGGVEAWADGKLGHIDKKRQQTHLRRQKQFEAEKQVAWDKYLEENPDVKARLIAEQKQRDKQYEVDSRHDRYNQMQSNASFATEYFAKRNAYSFSKALPRRPEFEGSYDELAKSSIEVAAKNRQEDGSIKLLGQDVLAGIVKERLPLSPDDVKRDGPQLMYSRLGAQGYEGINVNTSQSFYNDDRQFRQEIQDRYDYTGGVATSLWKMGFVEFESEQSIPYAKGNFNSDIEWSRGEDGTTFASLAYDPENELHRIIGGEQTDPSNARIQLSINDTQRYAPEMSVNLVRQPALAPVA